MFNDPQKQMLNEPEIAPGAASGVGRAPEHIDAVGVYYVDRAPSGAFFVWCFNGNERFSFKTKKSDAGKTPKGRPGKTIGNFGSTWQIGGQDYHAPRVRTVRSLKQSTRSAHSARYIIKDGGSLKGVRSFMARVG
jgi:hypothetical protein